MRKVGLGSTIDPSATVSSDVELTLGDGTHLGAGVHVVGRGHVTLGDYCKVHAGCFINVGDGGHVILGHNCWFGERCVLDGTGGLRAGNNVGAGIGSQLYTHVAHGDVIEGCTLEGKRGMVLEDDVWFVGQCFVNPILAKAKSTALLGSVITKDMEAQRVYGGNPAKDITDRIGPVWRERDPHAKLEMLQARLDEYCALHPGQETYVRSCIVPCLEYPKNMSGAASYFNVTRRRYTKRLSVHERRFMAWLTSYKGRFTPEEQP